MLIVGALLGPVVSDLYHHFHPSQEAVAISNFDDKAEERDKAQNQKLDEVLAKQGNKSARDEYLAAQKDLISLYAEKMITEPDDTLLKKQKDSLDKIKDESQKEANLYELKWEPVRHLILTLLDGEISNWESKGLLSNIGKTDIPVIVSEINLIQGKARTYNLVDGSELWIWQESGRIEGGKLRSRLIFSFNFKRKLYRNEKLLEVKFASDHSEIRCLSSDLKLEPQFFSKLNNPMKDKKFMDNLAIAFSQVVNYAIVHSDTEID